MFGEESSESPRLPSPWLALGQGREPSPSADPIDLNDSTNVVGNLSDKLCQSLSSSFSSLSISPASMVESELTRRLSEGGEGSIPRLVPEVEDGNIEYKLKLISPSGDRFARLVTQLKWRLLEGGGQAIYEIGVADSGQLVGLTQEELELSLETLERMADELGATVVISRTIEVPVLQGRIEGAGRVRAMPTPTPFAPHVNMRYTHKVGREWEGEKVAVGGGKRKEKKLAAKAKKRDELAGSRPSNAVSKYRYTVRSKRGSTAAAESSLHLLGDSPDFLSVPPPSDEESNSGSASDTTFYLELSSASSPSPSSLRTSPSSADILPIDIDFNDKSKRNGAGGDDLQKAMSKRMKRDFARERTKGLLVASPRSPIGKPGTRELGLDTDLAAAMPKPPTFFKYVADPDKLIETEVAEAEVEEETEADEDSGRWIVEVLVLRKLDADAGEGFLDFEGFAVE